MVGTIPTPGRASANLGFAMRRGTLLRAAEPELPPTFKTDSAQGHGSLALLARDRAGAGGPLAPLAARGNRVRHWLGDLG